MLNCAATPTRIPGPNTRRTIEGWEGICGLNGDDGAKPGSGRAMYRHILIPTDGSELAGRAVRHGLALAKSAGAKVTALTVEPSFDVYTVPASRVYEMSGA